MIMVAVSLLFLTLFFVLLNARDESRIPSGEVLWPRFWWYVGRDVGLIFLILLISFLYFLSFLYTARVSFFH